MVNMRCVLCSDDLSPILEDSRLWHVVLNRNQNLVGKSMPVSRRHIESVDHPASTSGMTSDSRSAR